MVNEVLYAESFVLSFLTTHSLNYTQSCFLFFPFIISGHRLHFIIINIIIVIIIVVVVILVSCPNNSQLKWRHVMKTKVHKQSNNKVF